MCIRDRDNTILAEDMYLTAKMILSGYKVAYCAEATEMCIRDRIKAIKLFESFDYASLEGQNVILFVVYAPKSLDVYKRQAL